MLISTLEKGKLSHLVLKSILEDKSFSAKDRAFINRTFSGTLEQLVYLDFAIGSFSKIPVSKMKPVIRNILRMSFYQMRFMDSVPVYTCIDEAVKLTRKRGFSSLAGFVNAVLRSLDHNADTLVLPEHVSCGVPAWIYTKILTQYGDQTARSFFRAIREEKKELTFRLNEIRYSRDDIMRTLEEEGCSVKEAIGAQGCYILEGYEDLTGLDAYRKGMIIMQDPSSSLAVEAAASRLEHAQLILDVCAAPGGKSLYAAQCFPSASVISRDLTEMKINLIRENLKRTGITNITPQVYDALKPDPFLKEKADLVIADLPCSGLGVIRRKPDILYRLKPEDPDILADLQRSILQTVKNYVRPGGILLYSTCTVTKEENDCNTEWFLNDDSFAVEETKQRIPGTDPYDGFYYAVFRKTERGDI